MIKKNKKKKLNNRFCAHGPVARGEEFRINDVVRSHNRKKIKNNNSFDKEKIILGRQE